ncbi:MAG: OmpA family protein [Acidobacteriota bacterium]|nr:OmpA family protein [Acidobacteriota bacterium]
MSSLRTLRIAGMTLAVSAALLLGACHKKTVPPAPPAPAPAPAQPTATLTAAPADIQAGQSSKLTWSTDHATSVSIDALGGVASNGSQPVTPSASTTYTLTATGPGGTATATARVTVTAAPAPAPSGPTEAELFSRSIKDIYFNYDRYDIRDTDAPALKADADFLLAHPSINFVIAGHCDERGSEDYNMALGSSRADSVKTALVKLGVSLDRIKTISYGKEKPFCTDSNESCFQQNRRAHFSLQ